MYTTLLACSWCIVPKGGSELEHIFLTPYLPHDNILAHISGFILILEVKQCLLAFPIS